MQHVTRFIIPRVVRTTSNCSYLGAHAHNARPRCASNLAFNADTQPVVTTPDGTRTLRTRKHGNRELPLSTILDPIAVNARTRHEKPKQRPDYASSTLTPFQRALSTNVYARALATPVRQCLISKARLPSQLLIPFVQNMITPGSEQDGSRAWQAAKPMLAPAITFKTEQPMAYVYGTEDFICELPGKRGKWPLLVTERMKKMYALRTQRSVGTVKASKEWGLRDGHDITKVVHGKLGASVLNAMTWCLRNEERLLVPFSEGMAEDSVACMIRVGGGGGKEHESAVWFHTFDLTQLLQMEQLQQARDLFASEDRPFALLRHTQTVITHLALLKLQQYVMNGGME